MKSLFVMDPLERIVVAGDSTYATMRECCDRGWPVSMCTPADLYAEGGRGKAAVTELRVTATAPYFEPREASDQPLSSFDVIWMRKDPPFDMGYILATYLLDMAGDAVVINDPRGLKLFSEKLWVMERWPHLHPDTLLSCDAGRLRAFIEGRERAVLKPWDGNGGRGVVVTGAGDRNLGALIELVTEMGSAYALAQQFLPGVSKGDKRILLFDGEPVGAMLRVPGASDHRGNMHVGASVQGCDLDERDVEICRELRSELKMHGMVFVGIDVIDGYLTEINVTSPTGIREINDLFGLRLESDLVDCVVAKVEGERR